MNPVDHPHGGGEEEHLVVDTHPHLGVWRQKVRRLEKLNLHQKWLFQEGLKSNGKICMERTLLWCNSFQKS
jgi:hypothetical protein